MCDDGRGAAVYFRRNFQDHQYAHRRHGRGYHAGLYGVVEAGAQGGGDLSRRLQAHPAAQYFEGQRGEKGRRAESKEPRVLRHRLPDERRSITHKFDIAGHEGYIIAGMYEDGQPGEIFITMSKEGSTISGLMDSFATAISIALQYGVPLQRIGRQVQPHALRALGFHQEPRYPDGQIDHGLYLPLAGQQVPRQRSAAGSRDCPAARADGTMPQIIKSCRWPLTRRAAARRWRASAASRACINKTRRLARTAARS